MKKILGISLIALFSVSPMMAVAGEEDASAAALTTKNYVDQGLAFVYGVADSKASQQDLTTLSNTVNNAQTGLATKASQADLNALQNQVNNIDVASYGEGQGVAINTVNDEKQIGLAIPANATNGTPYVYKPGDGWSELEVENTWDPTFLTGSSN